jgi:hypothetical protein
LNGGETFYRKMNSFFITCREAGWILLHAGGSLETRLLLHRENIRWPKENSLQG